VKWARNLVACALIAAFVFYCAAGCFGSSQAMGEHEAWRKLIASPQDFGLNSEVVSFSSLDGIPLRGWWLPAERASRGNLVLAHGRDANRSYMLSRARFLVRAEYNVLAIDLRLHGESGGRYITPGYLEAQDILGAIHYLREHGQRAPVAVLGHSYGGVAAFYAAGQSNEIAATISDGAFESGAEVLENLTRHYLHDPATPLWARSLLAISKCPGIQGATRLVFYLRTGQYIGSEMTTVVPALARIHMPVLFISGEQDFIAPTESARRMFAALPSKQKVFLLLPNAGHNTTYKTDPGKYESTVLEFLTETLGRTAL